MPNGAFFMAPTKNFSGNFYGKNTQVFEMPIEKSIDVDHQSDLVKADAYLREHQGNQDF